MKTIGLIVLGIFALSAILTVISQAREYKDRLDGEEYREHQKKLNKFKKR